jgi:thiamine-phosphate pyrophosphorylase
VSDRRRLLPGAADAESLQCLVRQARHAIDAGIQFIQVRERDLEAGVLAATVAELVALARGSATNVIVNDRVDVAIASGAAGVHLRADSVPPQAVRSVVHPGFIVGRSVHSEGEAREAAPYVDYLIAGTVWPTSSKGEAHPVLGLDGLRRIVSAVRVPVLAIGGVTQGRVSEVAASGAAGLAAIGLFMGGEGTGRGCRAVPLKGVASSASGPFDTLESSS